MFKTVLVTVLCTIAVVSLIAAAVTRITVNQILASTTVGQVVTTTAPGTVGWASLPVGAVIPSFADAEVPSGLVNGINLAFTLAHAGANTGASLVLTRNGVVQQGGGSDYTLAGSTITFVATNAPQTGDTLQAWYRY